LGHNRKKKREAEKNERPSQYQKFLERKKQTKMEGMEASQVRLE